MPLYRPPDDWDPWTWRGRLAGLRATFPAVAAPPRRPGLAGAGGRGRRRPGRPAPGAAGRSRPAGPGLGAAGRRPGRPLKRTHNLAAAVSLSLAREPSRRDRGNEPVERM